MKTKKFEGLLISEIKKAEKLANKHSGFDDCKITGYSSKTVRPIDFDQSIIFIEVTCEICRNYEQRCDFDILLDIPMFDRRRTTAKVIENHMNISSKI